MVPPARVLVGVDFSASSHAALDFGVRLARHCGAELHVRHVEDSLLLAAARDRGFDLVRQSEGELRRFAATVVANGRTVYSVVEGNSVDALIAEARGAAADLLVVGAHGMSGAARLVFGSTTEGVLRHSPCSVLVVPDTWT